MDDSGFAECLFFSENRHQTCNIPSKGSNQWVFKEIAGAACEECTIIWKDIYAESKRPGKVDMGGVWYPPPREDVELWSDDYYYTIGMAATEDDEGNSLSPPREDVERGATNVAILRRWVGGWPMQWPISLFSLY
jgi:hypothetical protein